MCLFVCFACLFVCLFACLFACLLVCLRCLLLFIIIFCFFFLVVISFFCWRSWRKSLHYPWVPIKHRRVASPHPVCDCCRIPSHPHLKNHQTLWNPVESQTAKRRGRIKKHPDFVFRMASSTCAGWISYKIHIQSGFASWSGHSTTRSDTCQTVLATLENSCTFESRVLQFVRIKLSNIYKIFNGFSLSAIGFDSNVPSSGRDLTLKGLGAENGARPANDASAGSMPKIHCLVNHRKHQEAKTMSPYVTVCHRMWPYVTVSLRNVPRCGSENTRMIRMIRMWCDVKIETKLKIEIDRRWSKIWRSQWGAAKRSDDRGRWNHSGGRLIACKCNDVQRSYWKAPKARRELWESLRQFYVGVFDTRDIIISKFVAVAKIHFLGQVLAWQVYVVLHGCLEAVVPEPSNSDELW